MRKRQTKKNSRKLDRQVEWFHLELQVNLFKLIKEAGTKKIPWD